MLKVFVLNAGRIEMDQNIMAADLEAGVTQTYPVPCFLIRHPRGNVLFDTGIHCRPDEDPAIVALEQHGIVKVVSRPEEHVIAQLQLIGFGADDIDFVVVSHFHYDHRGGNEFFPKATFIVQKAEMDTVQERGEGLHDIYPMFERHELNYLVIDGEHDVFGDGSVVAIPTPGHTAGHQSLLLREAGNVQAVITGDACYDKRSMDRGVLPPVGWNLDEAGRSARQLKDYRDKHGATVLFGHDALQVEALKPGIPLF